MRLSLTYEISPTKILRIYRIGFLSLIKKIIESQNKLLYDYYYTGPRLKPFTFTVYFPKMRNNDNDDNFNVGDIAILNFSALSLDLIANIYNGFMSVDEYRWNNNGKSILFKPKRVYLLPKKKIRNNEIIVKTLSPILVNNIGNSNKFLWPNEDGFWEGLEFSVRQCAKEFLGYNNFNFEFYILSWGKKVIYHYQKTSAFTGIFKIKSNPDILQMIYDIGLGVHRSQGFGMLEVIEP